MSSIAARRLRLGAWGFRNNAGKTAFAGKTGTSRDGWFAGFTPELVVVVYVGFDNGDDLGMKGADSAMPIWADFVKEALAAHPEWNGDWAMPAGIRKAEIDIRNGALIRELDTLGDIGPTPTPVPTPVTPKGEPTPYTEELPPVPEPEIYVTNVPAEFRRIEIFITGTVPNRSILPMDDAIPDDPLPDKTPSPTPVNQTWQDGTEPPSGTAPSGQARVPAESAGSVTIMICPVTGNRATINCPDKQAKTFKSGSEPKDFCTFHR
ncbi:MAG: hypothetical protein IPK98_07640 [Chloracidobacterium sp.]|nr:hypothetical protein [Chloracidobacterium sp.]